MRIRCPHCNNAIEILDDQEGTMSCPSCGSRLSFLDETLSLSPTAAGRLGPFELLEVVGKGHFGEVWKARDTALDRTVAVKIPRMAGLDGSTRQRFLREARAAAQLRHPNIVTVHEVGLTDDQIYIVSEFIEGVTLAGLIAASPLPTRRAVEICIQVGQALQHAHERGVIHRDIKPQNILVDLQDQPHVADFGLAKREGGEITMTVSGAILGTCAYMSPEQARGDAHQADARSDVYSLGVVLYQLLAGRRPFEGGKRMLLYQVVHDDPPPPRKHDRRIPRDLETVVLKALAKEPGRRYQSAQEFVDDLQRFLDGRPIHARRVSQVERGWRWMRRNPALSAAIGGFLLLGLALTVLGGREVARRHAGLCRVSLATDPPGARVTFIPLDAKDGTPLPERRTPDAISPLSLSLEPGDFLVAAWLDDGRFHEVLRHVPKPDESPPLVPYPHCSWKWTDGRVELPPIRIPAAKVAQGMALLPATEAFDMGGATETLRYLAPLHARRVPAFYLDTSEVTVGTYVRVHEKIRPTPGCCDAIPADDHAMICVTWDRAAAFAELAGKRLPTEAEFEYAATNGGQRKDVSSVEGRWTCGPVGGDFGDRCDLDPQQPVFGLFSNAAEWTASRFSLYPAMAHSQLSDEQRQFRVIRGGSYSVVVGQPKEEEWRAGPCCRVGRPVQERQPGLGFRCARSVRPRLHPQDFEAVLSPATSPVPRPTK